MTAFFLSLISAFGISCLATRFLISYAGPFQVLDRPNRRSLHNVPTPRTGGLAIWGGVLSGVAIDLFFEGVRANLAYIGGAALLVGSVSALDDRFQVPAGVRAIFHLCAGALIAASGLEMRTELLPGALYLPAGGGVWFTVLFVVWMTNLYNFMDGIDGFAGGMAVFGFGTLGLLGLVAGDDRFAVISWSVAASAGGFLVWNFPPARIFMGDAGSSVLGLLAAALSLWADDLGLFPLWISMLVFSPFVVDATVTVIGRIVRGERLWQAHRGHYYQRLVQLGWGHKKTVLVEYGLMMACAVSAVLLLDAPVIAQWFGLLAWGSIYAIGIYAVRKQEASLEVSS